jgi:hypothetical protein
MGRLARLFDTAFKDFLHCDRQNILDRVSERNLCARLAIHLQSRAREYGYGKYFADCEYNRMGSGRIKQILDENLQRIGITCDLILHSRGSLSTGDNLIAIEMKKSEHPNREKDRDRRRLIALTQKDHHNQEVGSGYLKYVCGYGLGVYTEVNFENAECSIEYYARGVKRRVCSVSYSTAVTACGVITKRSPLPDSPSSPDPPGHPAHPGYSAPPSPPSAPSPPPCSPPNAG